MVNYCYPSRAIKNVVINVILKENSWYILLIYSSISMCELLQNCNKI